MIQNNQLTVNDVICNVVFVSNNNNYYYYENRTHGTQIKRKEKKKVKKYKDKNR